MLTDNGAVFTGIYRGRGWVALERELTALGIGLSHCRPCHPQTCGKVGRLHQTLKKWLARQDPAATVAELQAQLDAFTGSCNTQRPHRAAGRRPPAEAWNARPKAIPARQGIHVSEQFQVRRDRVDTDGKLTLRHNSRLHHIGIGRRWSGTSVLILARDLELRIITQTTGTDPRAHPRPGPRLPAPGPEGMNYDTRHLRTMSRDTTLARSERFEPPAF